MIAGYNNYGQLFTSRHAETRTSLNKSTRRQKHNNNGKHTKYHHSQTAAIADDSGLVYTVGYNGNGAMGDETTTSTTAEPASISEASLEVNTRKIQY